MTLLSSLIGSVAGEEKRHIHPFASMLAEYGRDPFNQSMTVRRDFIIGKFNLSASEQIELDLFIAESTSQVVAIRDELTGVGISAATATKIAITTYAYEAHNILLNGEDDTYTPAQVKMRLKV